MAVPAMFWHLGFRNVEHGLISVPGDQGEGEPVRKHLVRVNLFKGTMSPIPSYCPWSQTQGRLRGFVWTSPAVPDRCGCPVSNPSFFCSPGVISWPWPGSWRAKITFPRFLRSLMYPRNDIPKGMDAPGSVCHLSGAFLKKELVCPFF